MPAKYCPDCGGATLRLIETTEVQADNEYKEVLTCDSCENILFVVRNGIEDGYPDHMYPHYEPEGMIDHDDEDWRAFHEEVNRQIRDFHHREGGGD